MQKITECLVVDVEEIGESTLVCGEEIETRYFKFYTGKKPMSFIYVSSDSAKKLIDFLISNIEDSGYISKLVASDHISESDQDWSDVVNDLKRQIAELERWKSEQTQVMNELDLQSLGLKLGIGLAKSISKELPSKIDELLLRVDNQNQRLQQLAGNYATLREEYNKLHSDETDNT